MKGRNWRLEWQIFPLAQLKILNECAKVTRSLAIYFFILNSPLICIFPQLMQIAWFDMELGWNILIFANVGESLTKPSGLNQLDSWIGGKRKNTLKNLCFYHLSYRSTQQIGCDLRYKQALFNYSLPYS